MTGVKTKELLIWVALCDMFVDKDNPTKITFKTPTGLGRTFPVANFTKEGEDPTAKGKAAAAAAANGKLASVALDDCKYRGDRDALEKLANAIRNQVPEELVATGVG
jgi:hypothetical protein